MDPLVYSLQHGHAVELMVCAHYCVQHLCESGCAGTSHTCHAFGKTWNMEILVVANPLAVFKPKLHGLKLEIESRAPGRQAGGPAVQ